MKRTLLKVLLLATIVISIPSAITWGDAKKPEIQVETYLSFDHLSVGKPFRIAIVVNLEKSWHIHANNAAEFDLIPTELNFNTAKFIQIENIEYPKGIAEEVEWAEHPIPLYSGKLKFVAYAVVLPNFPIGETTLHGSLRYQACSASVCLPPTTLPITIKTTIVGADVSGNPTHPEIFGADSTEDAQTAQTTNTPPKLTENSIDSLLKERGWAGTLLLVFLAGLALNLTPCVYPMIAITVSYFGGREDKSKRHAFTRAFVYFLGVVITYSSLGLAAALTGGLFGALLQSTPVLIGVALLLILLALSMFGLFEFQPPQFLMQRASGLSSKAGYIGVFFLGAMVGIIAAPCIAPILVALLAFVGQRGDPLMGWLMFFVLACGLGIPYIILGTYSGLLTKLPKSGRWMVWVKRVFGVVLILVAIWFLKPLFGSKVEEHSLIDWQPFSQEIVTNPSRPILIDFYADWCIPCHEMDQHTFHDPRIVEKAKLFHPLKADLTSADSDEVQQLVKQFNILGVPTFIFIATNGVEYADLRQIGFVDPNTFLAVMDAALSDPLPEAQNNQMMEIPAQMIPQF